METYIYICRKYPFLDLRQRDKPIIKLTVNDINMREGYYPDQTSHYSETGYQNSCRTYQPTPANQKPDTK